MKTFLYWSLVVVLAGALLVVTLLGRRGDPGHQHIQNFLISQHRDWVLSGDHHLFDVTERGLNLDSLDGFKEGRFKWSTVGLPGGQLVTNFVTADANIVISQDEYVLGVVNGTVATAYPVRILVRHQVINDTTQNPPVLAYFSTNSHTAAAYRAHTTGGPAHFASTGFLHRHADLLFDIETESLFHPITGVFAAGERVGERAELLGSALMTLGEWLTLFPDSRIMTTNVGTGPRTYQRYSPGARPPILDRRLRVDDQDLQRRDTNVIALRRGWQAISAALPAWSRWSPGTHEIRLLDNRYTLHLLDTPGSAYITDQSGSLAPSVRALGYIFHAALDGGEHVELEAGR